MAQDGAELFDYAQKVLPWLGPIWAELFENCEEFCPELAQDGHNFWQYTRSSALAMPEMDKNFCDLLQVLLGCGPRWANL